jgi:hypothetical protein
MARAVPGPGGWISEILQSKATTGRQLNRGPPMSGPLRPTQPADVLFPAVELTGLTRSPLLDFRRSWAHDGLNSSVDLHEWFRQGWDRAECKVGEQAAQLAP